MALFWTESFESNQVSKKINANGSNVLSAGSLITTPRTGSWASSTSYKVAFGASDQDDLVIVGAAFRAVTSAAGEYLLFRLFGDAGVTEHVCAYIVNPTLGSPATINVYRGNKTTGTLLGTSSTFTLPATNTFIHAEIKARLHDSTGSVVVRVDEAVILTLSGVDTKNGGAGAVFDAAEASAWNIIDDIYMANEQGSVNTDFQGAKRVEVIRPNGNGATSNGVGSDGNSTDNYLLVDDPPTVNTADYVDLATTGDKDTYAHEDSAQPTTNAVAGAFVWAYAQKTDAGSRTLIPVARLSGTESDADPLPLQNGTFKLVGDVFETKPGGGGWSVSDINSAEFGYKAGA